MMPCDNRITPDPLDERNVSHERVVVVSAARFFSRLPADLIQPAGLMIKRRVSPAQPSKLFAFSRLYAQEKTTAERDSISSGQFAIFTFTCKSIV